MEEVTVRVWAFVRSPPQHVYANDYSYTTVPKHVEVAKADLIYYSIRFTCMRVWWEEVQEQRNWTKNAPKVAS